MKKYKFIMICSIIIVAVMILQIITPMFSMANIEDLNIGLEKVSIDNGYRINIAGSSSTKILALKYVVGKISVSEFDSDYNKILDYFEGNNSKAVNLNITSDNFINEYFDVDNTVATYTVYARNMAGEMALAYITINVLSDINLDVKIQNDNGSKSLQIKADSDYEINSIKVLKVADNSKPANFSGVKNLITKTEKSVEINYNIPENGLYQVYVETVNKSKKIQTVSVFDGESSITINTKVDGKVVLINVLDSISSISEIKIAKASEITSIESFKTKGSVISFEGTNNINVSYNVEDNGTYVIFAKNKSGNSLMKSVNVVENPEISIDFYRIKENNKVYVIAKNNVNDINFVTYILSENQMSKEDVKNKGKVISVTSSKDVGFEIELPDISNNRFLSVYVTDVFGYGYMKGMEISGIPVIDKLPEQHDSDDSQDQNTDNGQDKDNNSQDQNTENGDDKDNDSQDQNTDNGDDKDNDSQDQNTDNGDDKDNNSQDQNIDNGQDKDENSQNQGIDNGKKENNDSEEGIELIDIEDFDEKEGSNNVEDIDNKNEVKEDDSKQEKQKQDDTISKVKIPQTGTKENLLIIGIIIFSISSIVSFIKYKKEE